MYFLKTNYKQHQQTMSESTSASCILIQNWSAFLMCFWDLIKRDQALWLQEFWGGLQVQALESMHSVHFGIPWSALIPEHGVAFFQKTQGILGIVILCMMPAYARLIGKLVSKKRLDLRNKSAETGLASLSVTSAADEKRFAKSHMSAFADPCIRAHELTHWNRRNAQRPFDLALSCCLELRKPENYILLSKCKAVDQTPVKLIDFGNLVGEIMGDQLCSSFNMVEMFFTCSHR